jgi:hypothetical protein
MVVTPKMGFSVLGNWALCREMGYVATEHRDGLNQGLLRLAQPPTNSGYLVTTQV